MLITLFIFSYVVQFKPFLSDLKDTNNKTIKSYRNNSSFHKYIFGAIGNITSISLTHKADILVFHYYINDIANSQECNVDYNQFAMST